jgi:hypothetical protein
MFELESLLRLTQNLHRGGHTDDAIRKDMGAEAAALVGALGPDRVPRSWHSLVDKTPEEIEEVVRGPETPDWLKKSIEAHLALKAVAEEIKQEQAALAVSGRGRRRRRATSERP